jgi:hypothetical protein
MPTKTNLRKGSKFYKRINAKRGGKPMLQQVMARGWGGRLFEV